MTVDEIIKRIKIKEYSRTRYEGQKPFWDEMLVAEIEKLREELAYLKGYWIDI